MRKNRSWSIPRRGRPVLILACLMTLSGSLLFTGTAAAATAATADPAAAPGSGRLEAEKAALQVMDAFLEAFNASDEAAWADTLVFPHVRLASGSVRVYPDRAAFIAGTDMAAFAASTGWRRSAWDDMAIVQSSASKVHIRVRFSRFDASDALLASYDSLYIIEQVDGRWGVRARSSFAP